VRGDPYARAVPAEPSPPELARVVGFAERPRRGDWSLRAALCRYAQAHPARVRDVLEQVRRVEAALHPHARRFDKDGPALWAAVDGGAAPSGDEQLVGVLRAAAALDRLGDGLAAWAEDRHGGGRHDRGGGRRPRRAGRAARGAGAAAARPRPGLARPSAEAVSWRGPWPGSGG
jgi:hypothetical protein